MAVWPPSSFPMAQGLPGSLGPATRVLFGPLRCERPIGWIGGRYTTSKPMAATSGRRLWAARLNPPSDRGNSSYQALNWARSRSTQSRSGSVRVRSAGVKPFFFCRLVSSATSWVSTSTGSPAASLTSMSWASVARRSVHASTTYSCKPRAAGTITASHRSLLSSSMGTSCHGFSDGRSSPAGRHSTRAARMSWPSR